MGGKLERGFYRRATLEVARDLIGVELVFATGSGPKRGRIVETEAYMGPEDQAAHSSRGRTARNQVMFGPAGFSYVYLIYGMWNCLNFVTAEEGEPHAVLVRAVEPLGGVEDRTWGPGLLCRAFGLDRSHNGLDLCSGPLWLEAAEAQARPRIESAARIGVAYAGEWAHRPWRFFDADSPFVSHLTAAQRRQSLAAAAGGAGGRARAVRSARKAKGARSRPQ